MPELLFEPVVTPAAFVTARHFDTDKHAVPLPLVVHRLGRLAPLHQRKVAFLEYDKVGLAHGQETAARARLAALADRATLCAFQDLRSAEVITLASLMHVVGGGLVGIESPRYRIFRQAMSFRERLHDLKRASHGASSDLVWRKSSDIRPFEQHSS
jgi:hypothetical protein